MATTKNQDLEFKKVIGEELPRALLQTSIDWIRDNMSPAVVYEMDDLVKYVSDIKMPEEVFSEEDLTKWAVEKGFTSPAKKDPYLSYAYSEPEKTESNVQIS